MFRERYFSVGLFDERLAQQLQKLQYQQTFMESNPTSRNDLAMPSQKRIENQIFWPRNRIIFLFYQKEREHNSYTCSTSFYKNFFINKCCFFLEFQTKLLSSCCAISFNAIWRESNFVGEWRQLYIWFSFGFLLARPVRRCYVVI